MPDLKTMGKCHTMTNFSSTQGRIFEVRDVYGQKADLRGGEFPDMENTYARAAASIDDGNILWVTLQPSREG